MHLDACLDEYELRFNNYENPYMYRDAQAAVRRNATLRKAVSRSRFVLAADARKSCRDLPYHLRLVGGNPEMRALFGGNASMPLKVV